MKRLFAATVLAGVLATPAIAGNGAPSGPHYNLNLIGVSQKYQMPNNLDSGHVIFVKLWGADTKILLREGEFQVLDKNGTDGEASFQLPKPDPENDGITSYSVFARALGKPGGSGSLTTCATDTTGQLECSVNILNLSAHNPQKFSNVSKYLLYVYADLDENGSLERVPLFGTGLVNFYWDYDVSGLKLAQLRFYPCATQVPDADNPGGDQVDVNCFD
jgi:hypothetical protein